MRTKRSPPVWVGLLSAFVLLNGLLFLPGYLAYIDSSRFLPLLLPSDSGGLDRSLLHVIRRPDQDLFRLHVDFVLLLTVAAFWPRGAPRRLAAGAQLAFALLLLYAIYEAVVGRLFHREPNLLDDMAYFPGAVYLAADLMTWSRGLVLASGAIILGLVLRGALRLVSRLVDGVRGRGFTRLRPLLAGFWLVYLPVGTIYGFSDFSLAFRSSISRAITNGARSIESMQTFSRIRSAPVDSTYFTYRTLTPGNRPDVYLFMIESYGSCLATDPDFRGPYHTLLDSLETALTASGWHAWSSHSIAPVYGGISWLSIATVLGGLEISSHALHSIFLQRASAYPHLVDLLRRWGYRTITLQPSNRKKPGLPLVNPFDFDVSVFGEDLAYEGTPYGLWGIPDQYSLGFTHERWVRPSSQPVFLFSESVSSHAPWETVPPLVDDWRELHSQPRTIASENGGIGSRLYKSLRNRLGARPEDAESRYFASIRYDLHVLNRFLGREISDAPSLVVILGDHQPPMVAGPGYGTPVHILSRDPELLRPLEAIGFSQGLFAAWSEPAAIRHESLFSLVVSLISSQGVASIDHRPAELKLRGVSPSILAAEE